MRDHVNEHGGIGLSAGKGTCPLESMLVVDMDAQSLEMGLGKTLLKVIFNAAHRINRHSRTDDFVALQLPDLGSRAGVKGIDTAGSRVCLFGRRSTLDKVIQDLDFLRFEKRQSLEFTFGKIPADCQARALVRNRACEKFSPGRAKRDAARRERRQAHITATSGQYSDNRKARPQRDFHIQLDSGVCLDILAVDGGPLATEVSVSTYGLSSAAEPQFLPLVPSL